MQELLKVQNLSFSYPDGHRALVNVNLTIYRGDSVAFIGPNGAGKSTLILHFNGILRSDGRVKLLDKPIDEDNLRWVRNRVGLVFQEPDDQLFSPTVFDDVAFGPINMGYDEEGVKQAVAKALALVWMQGFEKRSSHHLSVGEKKRIALATVLAMSPEVLVIDEPTSNLDPRGKWSLADLLKSLPVTKVIVTHDLEMVQEMCNRVVIIDGGRVIADGATDKILVNRELLAAHGLTKNGAA